MKTCSFFQIISLVIGALVLSTQTDNVHAGRASNKSKASLKDAVPVQRELSSTEMAAAGAFATAFGVTIMHPVDTIKTLQQSNEGMGLNMIAATNKIMKVGKNE